MKQYLIAEKSMTYATRRLQAGDEFVANRRDARILVGLGRARHREAKLVRPAPKADADVELKELRALYKDVVGKNAFHGWDADELQRRIDAAS